MSRSCKVAVIGAGPAGLVTARELRREGHRVVVFEKADRVGGTWLYDPRVEVDPLGLDSDRRIVHSSLYSSLRTNLPRQLMGFLDYPFPEPSRSFGDPRAFPSYEEVLAFLEGFARDFGILEMVRFGTEVVRVAPGGRKDEWVVESRTEGLDSKSEAVETFQAVVVCIGHNTEPRIAEIPGIDRWPGKQTHSHNYRIPEPFRDQIVVLIGMGLSAHDISREISKVAREVHLVSRSVDVEVANVDGHDNIWQHSMIKCVCEDGLVVFHDGTSLLADVIFHCTGYKYYFPFLETNGSVSVDDNRIDPLYKHVFPPQFAPWLSFVGIPTQVIVFLLLELQSKWIACILSNKVALPPQEDMTASVEELYLQLEEIGKPKHYTHALYPNEAGYLKWLVAELGLPPLEEWREQMHLTVVKSLVSHDDGYRDTWDDEYWIQQSQSTPQKELKAVSSSFRAKYRWHVCSHSSMFHNK